MDNSSMLKKQFLKTWINGLKVCYSSSKKQMNLMERKKQIKLSADIAMASIKKTPTSWSEALISNARKNKDNLNLVNAILGPESHLTLHTTRDQQMVSFHKRVQSIKILKRSCGASKRTKKKITISRSNLAIVIAKKLVKKRTKVLKRLIPGGESLDEFSLIKEALDYILSLTVQADVMRNIVNYCN